MKRNKLSKEFIDNSDEEAEKQTATLNENNSEADSSFVVEKNAEGESFVKISAKRRATIRKWKTGVLIDIREFYGDNSDKPGNKGISLSVEQWEKLKQCMNTIDSEIKKLEK